MKTQEELLEKLDALGKIEPEQRRAITCVLIGHSRLVAPVGALLFCARCMTPYTPARMDTLVYQDHDCVACNENRKRLNWEDTLFVQMEEIA